MKVKELIKKLKAFDGETQVIMSSDAEGNSFHEVENVYEDTSSKRATIYPKHGEVEV